MSLFLAHFREPLKYCFHSINNLTEINFFLFVFLFGRFLYYLFFIMNSTSKGVSSKEKGDILNPTDKLKLNEQVGSLREWNYFNILDW